MRSVPLHRAWTVLGLACAAVAIVATVASPAQAARTPDPLPDDAVQATIDPTTGRLAALGAEDARSLSAEMQRMFDRSPEMLDPLVMPNGMLMIELDETFMEAMVVRAMPDGSLHTFCAPERGMPVLVNPATPAILLPIWASLPRANTTQTADSDGLEVK